MNYNSSYLDNKNIQKKLKYLSKYIWFDKEETLKNNPNKIIAYAMRYASIEDYNILFSLGEEKLKKVLKNSQPGWFDKKNWIFWHTILKVTDIHELPKRKCL